MREVSAFLYGRKGQSGLTWWWITYYNVTKEFWRKESVGACVLSASCKGE